MAAGIKELKQNLVSTNTIENISSIFELISTIRINHIRKSVLASEDFFNLLQKYYLQLRNSNITKGLPTRSFKYDRRVSLIITTAGSFSGPADQQIVDALLASIDPKNEDIIVIGRRGIRMLELSGIKPVKSFDSPDVNLPIDVGSLSSIINQYRGARAFYQSFESIAVQSVKEINLLISTISNDELSAMVPSLKVSRTNHIFEPTFEEIFFYLEGVILNVTLSQIIYEAQLSEFANRFKYTSVINDRASKQLKQLTMRYNRTRRQIKDEALREQLVVGLN